ncbi:conserved membrane protein of unknown function [Rhodovastum atsumiense]|uniref:DUF2269 family protein n=1 Tax=Rhodovastum atsumiense TaxID=504468 RepID=A0A5M6IMX0_9PROT|nr:DUF2269 family protein [Rhodovastum atsumiense]KAA5608898.1 DUF2269 family protein [Rhodovastum atsumiense]CAH2602293.1 conserved membrane protein of unknown function [Rhodovastum atsumiense]
MYLLFKALHVVGVVLLLGNVTVSAVWKLLADRTCHPAIMAHAVRLMILTDWWLTLTGGALTMGAGYAAAMVSGLDPFRTSWILSGHVLMAVSVAIWLVVLVPLQIRQSRQARAFRDGSQVDAQYWRDSATGMAWGVVATVPLFIAVCIMVLKP